MVDSFRTSTMAASAPASRTIGTGQRQIGVEIGERTPIFKRWPMCWLPLWRADPRVIDQRRFLFLFFLNFFETLYIRDFSFIFICTTETLDIFSCVHNMEYQASSVQRIH